MVIPYESITLAIPQKTHLRQILDKALTQYYKPDFIADDPISIPHTLSLKQDIEIAGFWTAILSWGNRKSILKSAQSLIQRMDGTPYDFIVHHQESDRKRFLDFKHRTFQPDDALYFLHFLQWYYLQHNSLEQAFITVDDLEDPVESGLVQFQKTFMSLPEFLPRTKKHISSPLTSSCKRLNMFLRWMIRSDDKGIDFGIWSQLKSADLYIPLDVHVFRVAKRLEITTYNKPSWKAVKQITHVLRQLEPNDPIKYDYAMFSMGAHQDFR